MTFPNGSKIEKVLCELADQFMFTRQDWKDPKDYEAFFDMMWNTSMEFFSRCKMGYVPLSRDYQMFFQEGRFEDFVIPCKKEADGSCSSMGRKVRRKFRKAFGREYLVCREDIQCIEVKFHVLDFWLQKQNGRVIATEYYPRQHHLCGALTKLGVPVENCPLNKIIHHNPIYREDFPFRRQHASFARNLPQVLIIQGNNIHPTFVLSQSIKIILFGEVEEDSIPSNIREIGQILRISKNIMLWIRGKTGGNRLHNSYFGDTSPHISECESFFSKKNSFYDDKNTEVITDKTMIRSDTQEEEEET